MKLAAGVLSFVALFCAQASAADPLPTLSLQSVTIKRTVPHEGFAGTASVHFRLCISVGPRAVLTTRETRSIRGVIKASATSLDPLGVDLDHVYPYDCVNNYESSWIVPSRLLVGGGTYSVSIRARDGYGRMSSPLVFSVRL